MEKINNAFENDDINLIFEHNKAASYVKIGTVVIQPNEKIPAKGFSQHDEDEYSIIISGEIEGESGGETYRVMEGNATLIPAQEEHWTINKSDKPCKIVYALVGKS